MPVYDAHYGLAGSIISAILQVSGLLSLHRMLGSLAEFLSAISVLLFVFATAVALFRFVRGGELRDALLVLLGPAAAVAMLFTTSSVQLTEATKNWTEGEVTVESGVRAMLGEAKEIEKLEIPLALVLANRVTDAVIRQVSSFILSDALSERTTRAARDRLMSMLLLAENMDPSYLMLLTLSLTGDCAEISSIDWELSRDRFREAPPGSVDAELATQMRLKRERLALKKHTLSSNVLDYLHGVGIVAEERATCQEIWLYSRDSSFHVASAMLSDASTYRRQFPELTDQEWGMALDFIREKLAPEGTTPADWVEAYRVLSAFVLRNTISRSAHGAMTNRLSGHSDWMLEREEDRDRETGALEQSLNSARNILLRFSASVPYVQGLCLYLLTVSFPFFCLLLIIPRQAGAILTWFSLWLWVKSWDIGFAIIYQIREIIWQFLPNAGDILGVQRLSDVNWNDPASLFTLLNAKAPEQQYANYYGLVAMLTLAVPVFMGYCFQAASQFADIVGRAMRPGGRA